MPNFTRLDESMEMWSYLGFEPWEHQGADARRASVFMKGISRKITLVKGSLMLPIARYYAWDYVVWFHQGMDPVEYLLQQWRPLPDVVTQRFLLIGSASPRRKAKSFWWGFKGFLEIYSYTPGGDHHPKVKDLTPPVDMAWGKFH